MKRGIFIMDIADTHKKSQYPFFSPWVSRPGISPSGGPDQNHVGRSEIFSAYDDPKTLIQGLSYPILLHCNRVKKFLVQLVSTVLSHFEKGHVRACVNLIPSLPLHPCSLSLCLSRVNQPHDCFEFQIIVNQADEVKTARGAKRRGPWRIKHALLHKPVCGVFTSYLLRYILTNC